MANSNFSFPINEVIPNPCGGEDISFSGNIHQVFNVITDANGGLHVTSHSNTQNVQGVGLTTGDKYRLVTTFNAETKFGPSRVSTLVQYFRVISQGNSQNFVLRFTITFVVNANGDVTVDNSRFEPECTG